MAEPDQFAGLEIALATPSLRLCVNRKLQGAPHGRPANRLGVVDVVLAHGACGLFHLGKVVHGAGQLDLEFVPL